jgi:hypothetical protein
MIERQDTTADKIEKPKTKEIERYQPKLTKDLTLKVVAMLARGERRKTIVGVLKDQHNIEYSEASVSAIKKKYINTIKEMEATILEAEIAESDQIRAKSLRMLNRKMDHATQDEIELEDLKSKFRDGSISWDEYSQQERELTKLSVNQLLSISKEMFAQANSRKTPLGAVGTPSGNTDELTDGASPLVVEALVEALKNKDTVTLSQIKITPNENA